MGTEVPKIEAMESILIEMAVEGWRVSRVFARVVGKLDAGEAGKYENQIRYFQKQIKDGLDRVGLSLVFLEGQPYDVGMAVTALNLNEFPGEESLFVEQTVEPIIMGSQGLRRPGVVMLNRIKP